jgi:hypothetical protein
VQIEALDPARLLSAPIVEDILAQIDFLAARHGPVYGDLNWQGVLNIAFHVRGQQIFLDLAERPELAARLFEVIAETLVRLAHLVQGRQRASGFPIDYMCVSNCTLSMISPALYRRMLLAHDARIARAFQRFGVHTCNWDARRYFAVFRELPPLGYLDMGTDTGLAAAKQAFPETRRAVLIHPNLLPHPVPILERIWRELAPCDVVLADIPWDTPDDTVSAFLRAARAIAGA